MGRDKAWIEVAGLPLVVRVARALQRAGAAETFIVGGDEQAFSKVGLEMHRDGWPGAGPLGGVITALDTAAQDIVVVLSCDLVSPDPEVIVAVVGALDGASADIAVPVVAGQRQWLHAAWRRRTSLPALRAAFESGERAVHRAAAAVPRVDVADVPPSALADADVPGDLREYPVSGEHT